jgi:hypothetical protein
LLVRNVHRWLSVAVIVTTVGYLIVVLVDAVAPGRSRRRWSVGALVVLVAVQTGSPWLFTRRLRQSTLENWYASHVGLGLVLLAGYSVAALLHRRAYKGTKALLRTGQGDDTVSKR